MNRSALTLGILPAVIIGFVGERNANACGGCFHPPTQTVSDITDERMLLSVSSTQSTLYDQIQYSGSPTSFAWVLPIHGTVNVGLSADVLFDSIDELTATQINPPESTCPVASGSFFGPSASANAGAGGATTTPGSVTVTKQQNVGPYATVQLHSTDPSALENWLSQNGYQIPADVQPVVAQYVNEGFDFLAMKLIPGQGIQAMRPVRVTFPGSSLSLPLRMASVGTGATVGITIWVVADGRYEPQNFPFFHIADQALVWDWSLSQSNYTTLRAQAEACYGGRGWEIESSIDVNQQVVTNTIVSGGIYYGGGGLGAAPPSNASDDYLPITADADAGVAGETADQVRSDDLTALFTGITGPNARLTRMRSDISHAAMTMDFILQASADQSELSNVRTVTQSVNEQCGGTPYGAQVDAGSTQPTLTNCPTLIPQITGQAPWQGATPANQNSNQPQNRSFGCATTAGPINIYDLGYAGLALSLGLLTVQTARRKRRR